MMFSFLSGPKRPSDHGLNPLTLSAKTNKSFLFLNSFLCIFCHSDEKQTDITVNLFSTQGLRIKTGGRIVFSLDSTGKTDQSHAKDWN
jgi:hypothetical protein